MKLVHKELPFQILFEEEFVPVCLIESPVWWRILQREIYTQVQGGEGRWVLSEEEKELKLSKAAHLILSPIYLDENQKSLWNGVTRLIGTKVMDEAHWKDWQEINALLHRFFAELETEFLFSYYLDGEIDVPALAKSLGLRIETDFKSDLERLLAYCILVKEVLGIKLFIFVQLHDYFTEKELTLLYEEIQTRKWNALLLETHVEQRVLGEKYYIIDKDGCGIY